MISLAFFLYCHPYQHPIFSSEEESSITVTLSLFNLGFNNFFIFSLSLFLGLVFVLHTGASSPNILKILYLQRQFLLKMLNLQRKFQMRKRILKFKDKVLSQFCQKMRNSYLMMIKSLSLMQLGFVLRRNFTARVMR